MATKKSKTKSKTKNPNNMNTDEIIALAVEYVPTILAAASRDKFAEVAMGKLLVAGLNESEKIDCEAIADDAFKIADAMMKRRQSMPDEVAAAKQ